MQYASERTQTKVSEDSINEVKNLQEEDKEELKRQISAFNISMLKQMVENRKNRDNIYSNIQNSFIKNIIESHIEKNNDIYKTYFQSSISKSLSDILKEQNLSDDIKNDSNQLDKRQTEENGEPETEK